MRSWVRLAFAMQRMELRLLLGAVLLISVAALGIAWQTRIVRAQQLRCYASAGPAVEGSQSSPCPAQDEPLQVLDQAAGVVKVAVLATPIVLGLFLGVPLVAREVEARTAPLAWSLSRSRHRWLVQRAAPTCGLLIVACVAAGAAGDLLVHAEPWAEGNGPGFEDWFSRGPQLAVRGLAVAGIGLLIGALVGRQLPAVLLGAVATLFLFASATLIVDTWMEAAAEPVVIRDDTIVSGKIYGSGYRDDATGDMISDEEAYARFGNAMDQFGVPPGYSMIWYVAPSRRYGEFVLYESGLFGLVAAASVGAAAVVVAGRRP